MPTIAPGATATLTLINFGPPAEWFINETGVGAIVSGDTSCPQTVGGWTIANFVYNSGAGTATLDLTVASDAAAGDYNVEYGNSTSGNVRGGAPFTVSGSGGDGVPIPTLTAVGVLLNGIPTIRLQGH